MSCLAHLLRCDFDTYEDVSTMCGMHQDTTADFDWTLWSGPTPSKETGPRTAYNGAYYMFIEASHPLRKGDKASCGWFYLKHVAHIQRTEWLGIAFHICLDMC